MSARDEILARLDALGIPYQRLKHQALFHMSDCVREVEATGAVMCKNYFLTTRRRKAWCLCVTRPNAWFRTSDISRQAGTPRLTFAEDDEMAARLRTYPGAVSPLGLMFDSAGEVRLLADAALKDAELLAFHPNDNTETLILSAPDFFGRFLPDAKHEAEWVEIGDFEGAGSGEQ